jgi:iron complex transport system substrate-binding protein
MRRTASLAAAALAAAALTAGCAGSGGDNPGVGISSPPAATSYPLTIGTVTLTKRPEKIVSLSPSATEMLFALGAGSQVVAVDDNSNYPAEAPKTALSGFKPNAEAVAGYTPDLVVLANDTDNIVGSLRALQIPVYVAPAAVTLRDTLRQIDELGWLTGHVAEGVDLARRINTDIQKLVRDVPPRATRLTYYYELDPTLYTVTSKTFIGSLFTLFGLENIADSADAAGSGYPQLSPEALLGADPDMIFLADTKCCQQSAATVRARAGWASITAVETNQIIALDDDIASRWGPRVVDLVRVIADAVAKAPA